MGGCIVTVICADDVDCRSRAAATAHVCAANQLKVLDPLHSQAIVVTDVVEVVERVSSFLRRQQA